MKNIRHDKILELIKEYDIETQEELARRLSQAGFNVTQATVSRDIRDMNLYKRTNSEGRSVYSAEQHTSHSLNVKYKSVLKDGFVSIDYAQNILVIKTVAGMAMAVAAAVDSMHFSEIVGTIAGDDTIMMAMRSVDDAILVMDKIKEIVVR